MSEYIHNYFKSEFLTEIKTVKNQKGELEYQAEISHDNTLYHLRFDAAGNLIRQGTEPLQELYDEEDGYPGLDD